MPAVLEMASDEAETDRHVASDKPTKCNGEASGKTPAHNARQPQQLPSFAVWQAGQLFARDVIFGSFLLLTFYLYLRSTVPELCSIGPAPYDSSSHSWNSSAPALQPAKWPWTFRLVCGHVTNDISNWNAQSISPWVKSRLDITSSASNSTAGHSAPLGPTAADAAQWQQTLIMSLRGVMGGLMVVCTVAALKLCKVLVYLFQGLFTFFACGFMTGDPFHMLVPPLRLSLVMLLLLPLPYPNLAKLWQKAAGNTQRRNKSSSSSKRKAPELQDDVSCHGTSSCNSRLQTHSSNSTTNNSNSSGGYISWYRPSFWWHHPNFRTVMIITQRLLPPAFAALSVGHVGERFFELTALRYWPLMGQYMYLGWMAWMLVVPFKVHLLVNFLEWLIIYSTAVRVRMVHYDSPLLCSTHFTHFLASLLFVLVMPTAGVAWLERGHKAHYQQALRLLGSRHSAQSAGVSSNMDSKKQHSGVEQYTTVDQQQDSTVQDGQTSHTAGCKDGSMVNAEGALVDRLLRHSSLLRRRVVQQHQQDQQQKQQCSSPAASRDSIAPAAAEDVYPAAPSNMAGRYLSGYPMSPSPALQAATTAAALAAASPSRKGVRRSSAPVQASSKLAAAGTRRASHSVVGSQLGDQLSAEISGSLQMAAAWRAKQKAFSSSSSNSVPFTIEHLMRQSSYGSDAASVVAAQPYQPYAPVHKATSAAPAEPEAAPAATASVVQAWTAEATPADEHAAPAPEATVDYSKLCMQASQDLFIVPELAPALKSLIGDQQAAAVFAAAAAASAAAQPGIVPYYTSRASKQTWNVGLQLA